MYIQITTACNMTCDHCCFSATAKGERMDHNIFFHALQLAARYGEFVTIGGGEPTTHKDFFTFLDKAIEYRQQRYGIEGLHVITNGKTKSKALRLLDYVERGEPIDVELSQDEFHDPIDSLVVQRFKAHDRNKYNRRWSGSTDEGSAGIRTVNQIQPVGRAVDTGVWTGNQYRADKCCCETSLVDPKGQVWSCGCKTHKLGWVWENDVLDDYNSEFAHFGGRDPEALDAEDADGAMDAADLTSGKVVDLSESLSQL